MLHARAGDIAGASSLFARAVELAPLDPNPHYALGVLQARAGDIAGAASLFARAVELAPLDPNARLQLGIVYEALGLRDEAVTHLTAASALALGPVEVFVTPQ